MPIVIREIVSEIVLQAPDDDGAQAALPADTAAEPALDALVRQATERVLEVLRREWEA